MAVTPGYVTSGTSGTNATIYDFGTVSIGTASADRINVVGAKGSVSTGTNSNESGITLGGAAMTFGARHVHTAGLQMACLYYLNVAAGTTANLTVTFGEGQIRAGYGVWALTGAGASATPSDTDSAEGNSTNDVSITGLTVPANGGAIIVFYDTEAGVVTWTGATERYDTTVETDQMSGADTVTAGTNTITADGLDSSDHLIVGIAFGPEAVGGQPTWKRFGGVPFMGGLRTSQGARVW